MLRGLDDIRIKGVCLFNKVGFFVFIRSNYENIENN
ncbi:hypothetical protein CBFG_00342 [Clostridiales bacterium 1_7_47FAA]|nr:hypothetical protein CBFG_00342 [Clostridiales bacterium 1_7_47FAA]